MGIWLVLFLRIPWTPPKQALPQWGGLSQQTRLILSILGFYDIGAPLSAFPKFLTLAAEANTRGHQFTNQFPCYDTVIWLLTSRLGLEQLKHRMESVIVPGSGRVHFPVFDFWAMVLSLLDDPRICPHLLINWENPSSILPFDIEFLDDIHSANWYHETHKIHITAGTNQVLMGIIIFFIDQTHTSNKDHTGCECVNFSLSIIPWSIHNFHYAWHPLGMADPQVPACQDQRPQFSCIPWCAEGDSVGPMWSAGAWWFYHQSSGTRGYGDFPLLQALCLSCKWRCRGSGQVVCLLQIPCNKYLSCECDCLMCNAKNPDVPCQRLRASTMEAWAQATDAHSKKMLQDHGYHDLMSTWTGMDFGANQYGINGCTLGEVLHMIQSGWIKYAINHFYLDAVNKENMPCLCNIRRVHNLKCHIFKLLNNFFWTFWANFLDHFI